MKFGIAISSYKSDNSTISLIEKIYSEKWNVEKIIVVESLGSGNIKSYINNNNISNFVDYYNYNTNIGSAKNLQIRMEKAYKFQWIYSFWNEESFTVSWDSRNIFPILPRI